MKPTLHHKLVNGPLGDPCLLVRIIRENRCLLFDLGDLAAIPAAVLGRVTHVFVTHTHMDHFIGFDSLLRTFLRRTGPLSIFGPRGLIRNIEGKLRGYTWNLIEHYPARIVATEFSGRSVVRAEFSGTSRFRKQVSKRIRSDGLLLEDRLITVRAAVVDHGMPCLAYALEEPMHIRINRDRLIRKGLTVGPWLNELKALVRSGTTGRSLLADGKRLRVTDLMDIISTGRGQKICYASDVAMHRRNEDRLKSLFRDADCLYCEAYYMEKDRDLALKRSHLTAEACGRIAREAGVKRLYPMHLSPRYQGSYGALLREVREAFGAAVSATI